MDYKTKYLKYKLKYLTAKKLYGGMDPGPESDEESFPPETPEKKVPYAPRKISDEEKLKIIFDSKKIDIFERFKEALKTLRLNEYNQKNFLYFTLQDIEKDMGGYKEITNLISKLKFDKDYSPPFEGSLPERVYAISDKQTESEFTEVTRKKSKKEKSKKESRKKTLNKLQEAADRMGFDILLMDRDSGEKDNSIGNPGDGLYGLRDNEYLRNLSETDLFTEILNEENYLIFFKQFYEISLSDYLNYCNKTIAAMLKDKIIDGKILGSSISDYLYKIRYEVNINLEKNLWEVKMYYNEDAVSAAADDGKDIPNVEPFDTVNITEQGTKQKAKDYFENQNPEDRINLPRIAKNKGYISIIVEKFIRLIISVFLKSYGDESYCHMILLFYSIFYDIATEEKKVKIFVSTHDNNLQNQLKLFCKPLISLNKYIKLSLALKTSKDYEINDYDIE